jgi:hypothetical protein
MADGAQELYPSKGGSLIDVEDLTVGGQSVKRQRIEVAGDVAAAIAKVLNSAPAGTEYALLVRPIGLSEFNRSASGVLGALGNTLEISTEGSSGAYYEIPSGLVGTVVFEATLDGTTWSSVISTTGGFTGQTSGTSVNAYPARGAFVCAGVTKIRLRVSVYTSGSTTAQLRVSSGGSILRLGGGIPAGSQGIGSVNITSQPIGVKGDVDFVTPAGSDFGFNLAGIALIAKSTAPAFAVGSEQDPTPIVADMNGVLYSRGHPPQIWSDSIDIAAAATTDLKLAPGAGLSLYLSHVMVSSAGVVDVTIIEETSAAQIAKFRFGAADAGRSHTFHLGPRKLVANKKLQCVTSAATAISVTFGGFTAA